MQSKTTTRLGKPFGRYMAPAFQSSIVKVTFGGIRLIANIENKGTIPSLPVIIQLIKVCGLPVERYFNPEVMREESAQRQRISHKLKLCPEQYLTVIEGALDGALKTKESADETEDV